MSIEPEPRDKCFNCEKMYEPEFIAECNWCEELICDDCIDGHELMHEEDSDE